ncbi:hypothetical protein [Stenotrophomonas oahuensis]|uniref:Uncharacterized protein n=1 Tax=Stenotrophomonas oahuensis TaxID=3003271 RepID=A0ABY9YVB0_9GAMM|nr:hypothetical protein [Stenotrophomonas sp. A5586]WNH54852.1 hypothetical protein PDM29_20780 [Stenotrophomonas sp. A5586]
MNIHVAVVSAIVALGLSACSEPNEVAPDQAPKPTLPRATSHTITLESGATIVVPEGVDILRTGWTYKNFTASEAAELAAACHREQTLLMREGKGDLHRPLMWVCRQAAASPENFKK